MQIIIVAPGKLESYQKIWFDEYHKRCRTKIELKEFIVKESQPIRRIEKESEKILQIIGNSSHVILLDIEGKLLSSNEFEEYIEKQKSDAIKTLAIVIGGAYGVSEKIKKIAHLKISFGKNTWPHNLMKIMVIEQLFRSETISDNRDYHH